MVLVCLKVKEDHIRYFLVEYFNPFIYTFWIFFFFGTVRKVFPTLRLSVHFPPLPSPPGLLWKQWLLLFLLSLALTSLIYLDINLMWGMDPNVFIYFLNFLGAPAPFSLLFWDVIATLSNLFGSISGILFLFHFFHVPGSHCFYY